MAELDGVILSPITNGDTLVSVEVTLKDSPGIRLVLTVGAVRELCDGFTYLLGTADWEAYRARFGVPTSLHP